MTESEWIELYLLRALDRREPAAIDELIGDVRSQAENHGLLARGQVAKIDRVYIGRDLLADWERREPPLAVQADYRPDELSPTGNILSHGRQRFELTDAGEAEMRRLESLAGLE